MLDILVRPDMNAHGREKIFIGRQGENLARRVKFDISEWRKLYGDGSAALVHRRPGDEYPYPCTVVASTDDGCFYWEVTKADVSVFGVGELQLRYYVSDALVKSQIWDSKIDESLDYPLGTKPDPIEDWINRVAQAAQEEVDKHLPTCAVTEITGGHRVTITDIDKSQSFNVMDGSTGNNGTDGYSPIVAVAEITGGHRVTITDIDKSQSFNVMDGSTGNNGTDGYSPIVAVAEITGGHRITITDESGAHTFDVMNGTLENYDYGTEDLVAGTTPLAAGRLYFVYE